MTDIADIAAGLSEAQRRAVLAMSERASFPSRKTFAASTAYALFNHPAEIVLAARVNVQTNRSSKWRDAYYLTPLGLSVRAHLLKETTNGNG